MELWKALNERYVFARDHIRPYGYLGHARVSLGFARIYFVAMLLALVHAILPNAYPDHSTVQVPLQVCAHQAHSEMAAQTAAPPPTPRTTPPGTPTVDETVPPVNVDV